MMNVTKGGMVTLAAVGSWALLLVVSRALLLAWDLDPWAFSFIQLITGGLFLLLLSSGGSVPVSALRRLDTWIFGGLRVLTASAFTAALVHVSVLQVGLLGVMNVPMAVLAVWFVFGRVPGRRELPGHLAILTGIALLIARLDGGLANPAVWLILISEIAVVASSLIAEAHPNNQGDGLRARLRFTGLTLVVTALIFLVVRAGQSMLTGDGGALGLDGLTSPSLWLAGLVVGVALRGPSMYLTFWSINAVGTHNYLAAVAFLPLVGQAFEYLLALGGWLPMPALDIYDLGLIVAIIGGACLILRVRRTG